MSINASPGAGPGHLSAPPGGTQKIIKFDVFRRGAQRPLQSDLGAPRWARKRPRAPEWRPKAHFWEPPGRRFGGKFAIVAPYENTSIYNGLATFCGSGPLPVRHQNPLGNAMGAGTGLFPTFSPDLGATWGPEGRPRGQKEPQGLPGDP